ncbi:MAG: SidA/IucD/PvdA family monooxygenase, partial [Bacteroidota bacterium]
ALFQAYARHVVAEHDLGALRERGRATGLRRVAGGWRVETDRGALDTRRVLLAMGNTEGPCWPGWAQGLRASGARVDHLFDATFDRATVAEGESVAVVGGGISAAQVATALARRGPTTLLSRHAVRVHQLDADPGWLGPKLMAAFHREPCPVTRREAITSARHRGSVPHDTLRQLRRAARRDGLVRMTAEVESATADATGTARLSLRRADGSATATTADRVVLATGFEAGRPGGAWLDDAIEAEGLPVAPCGFPRLRHSLAWAPGLYATGPLAELELGPTARNIAGARAAADRLPDA